MKFTAFSTVAAVVISATAVFGAASSSLAAPELSTAPASLTKLEQLTKPEQLATPESLAKANTLAIPAISGPQGSPQRIICKINRDRVRRYLAPVFLHRTLSDAAQSLGQRYADNRLNSAYFDQVFNSRIAPLGNSVSSSYKVLGTFNNDDDYVDQLEQSIYDSLFARTLDAIGIYENAGVYTIVLASGLRDRPSSVDSCPNDSSQYEGPNGGGNSNTIENGVDLPAFLCAINRERQHANVDAFPVHTALHNEAWEQAKQMSRLGHYTVNGPRKVDESIYGQRVNVKELYWVAGDSFHNAQTLVDVVMSSYGNKVLDPKYQVIGVAQKDGFWSVIFGSLYRSVYTRNSCPLTLGDVDYTS
ncbi:hypothetical protein IWW50_001947 [Coemansia erecta]|nr:hypothetical protein IWW50_001947 [Coemansia erecta]